MRIFVTVISFLTLVTSICRAQTRFKDVTDSAGIHHSFKVYEGMFGGGACVIDYNNDGFEDLFITGGTNDDQLLKNNGNGTFTNLYEQSGLTASKKFVTQGVAGADVNRDGFVDLFVTTITSRETHLAIPRGVNILFINKGDGTFRDATKEYGLDQLYSFSTGASFGDFNADGWPDIYVGNYFNEYKGKLSVINDNTIMGSNQISSGYLFLNEKGKHFRNVYNDYGLFFKGFGFGGVFTDYDNDGDQDLIVNHDFGYKRTPDLLLENHYPRKTFSNVAPDCGMDLKINSMGTAVGDYNNDGLMDYYFTNIKFNCFMVNQGNGKFVNKTQDFNMNFYSISWGANFADFDHDGDVDLFVANGDLNPNCVAMGDFYFENRGDKWPDMARAYGLNDYGIGRGSVTFDYDKDGDMDLLVVNQTPILPDYPVTSFTRLYRNDSTFGNWIEIALKGIDAESQGIGSKIEVEAGGKKMIREIDGGGSSHISQNSVIAHFGLSKATKIDRITVYWTGGNKQSLTNVSVNQKITIIEIPAKKTHYWYWAVALAVLGVVALYFYRRNRSRSAV